MKKNLKVTLLSIAIVLLSVIASAQEPKKPIFTGSFKGCVRDYYPNAVIKSKTVYINSATLGFNVATPNKINGMFNRIVTDFEKDAMDKCKTSSFAAIDNVDAKISAFDSGSVVLLITANAVCFE